MATSKEQQMAESAVRNYLKALTDPDSMRDTETIERLKKKLSVSDDPIERLLIRRDLRIHESNPAERYLEGFVIHAKTWADSVNVDAHAFLAEGVSEEVLRAAGFPVGRRVNRQQRVSGTAPRRGRRVTGDVVKSAMPTSGTFTISDLAQKTGASVGTIRKALNEMIEAKLVTVVGRDPDHEGPGRAPILYERIGAS